MSELKEKLILESRPNNILECKQRMEAFNQAREIGEDRLGFRKTLETYVGQAGYIAPPNPRILDLGCGECHEAFVLSSYFGIQPDHLDSGDVCVVGIDPKQRDIETASMNNPASDGRYKFIVGDARCVKQLVDGEFDVAIARHPEISHITNIWREIFSETRDIMRPEGILISTTYADFELEELKKQVGKAGLDIVLTAQNYWSPVSRVHHIQRDKYILIARK